VFARAHDYAGKTADSNSISFVVKPNQLPSGVLLRPTDSATFIVGDLVPFEMTSLLDPDGRVVKVEYLDLANTTVMATSQLEPFSTVWAAALRANETQSQYSIRARITDNKGGVELSTNTRTITVKSNTAPTVTLTAPTRVFRPEAVTLSATTTDPDPGASIQYVDFFQRIGTTETLIDRADKAPFAVTWNVDAAFALGNVTIIARAKDDRNSPGETSRVVEIAQNRAPSKIVIKKPAMPGFVSTVYLEPAVLQPNQLLVLEAEVADADLNIVKVEFFVDQVFGTPFATINASSANQTLFAATVAQPASLSDNRIHFIHAKATDSKGESIETHFNPDLGVVGYDRCAAGSIGTCENIATPVALRDASFPAPLACSGTPELGAEPQWSNFCPESERHQVALGQVIQSEQYDSGGMGLGAFDRDKGGGDSWRSDDVEIEAITCAAGPETNCFAVADFDAGEYLSYQLNAPTSVSAKIEWHMWFPTPLAQFSSLIHEQQVLVDSNNFVSLEIRNIDDEFDATLTADHSGLERRVKLYADGNLVATGPADGGWSTSSDFDLLWIPEIDGPEPVEIVRLKAVVETVVSGQLVEWTSPASEIDVEVVRTLTRPPSLTEGAPGLNEGTVSLGEDEPNGRENAVGIVFDSGNVTRAIDASCPGQVTKDNPADPKDRWFTFKNCSTAYNIPAGDYRLRVYSQVDGLKYDWFRWVDPTVVAPSISVAITSPLPGATFVRGTPVIVDATTEGDVSRVDFFTVFNGVESKFGEDSSPPFSAQFNSNAATAASVTILARAFHEPSGSANSQVNINFINAAASVTIAQPAANQQFDAGQSVGLAASAVSTTGQVIDGVDFLVAGVATPIAATQGAGNVWTASWLPPTPAAGAIAAHSVTAIAIVSNSPVGTSSAIAFSVRGPVGPGAPHETPVELPTVEVASDAVGFTTGEFRVDESGAATYSVPISVFPGRAGVQPSIAINYSSQGGDGPLGRGWSISGTSAISRCRQTVEHGDELSLGSPAIAFDESDRFCLDGQRLLLIDGTYGGNGAVYRTEIDSFAQIRSYDTDGVNGPNFFVVQRKDGSTAWYGDRISRTTALTFIDETFQQVNRADAYLQKNDGTGVNVPAESEPALTWAMTRSMDSKGNFVDFEYDENPVIGEQVLRFIRYTGHTRLAGLTYLERAPFQSVEFNYSPLANPSHAFHRGMLARMTQQLDSITATTTDSATAARRYELSYRVSASGTAQRLLESVKECAGIDGSHCRAPTMFTWSEQGNSFSQSTDFDEDNFAKYVGSKLGDVDGDGRLDLVWIDDTDARPSECPPGLPTGTQVVRTQFSKYINGELRMDDGPALVAGACTLRSKQDDLSDSWHLIDYNRDGRDDLLIADQNDDAPNGCDGEPCATPNANGRKDRWHIYPSLGRVSGGQVFDQRDDLLKDCPLDGLNPDPECVPVTSSGALAQIADLNGDGLVDLVYAEKDGQGVERVRAKLMVRDGTQYRFDAAVPVTAAWKEYADGRHCGLEPGSVLHEDEEFITHFRGCDIAFSNSKSRSGRSPQLADANGDGRADLVVRQFLRADTVRKDGNPICVEPLGGRNPLSTSLAMRYPDDPTSVSLDRLPPMEHSGPGGPCVPQVVTIWEYFSVLLASELDLAANDGSGELRLVELDRVANGRDGVSSLPAPFKNPDIVDLNGDGLAELIFQFKEGNVITEDDHRIFVARNDGVSLGPMTELLTATEGRHHMQLFDANGDGRTDIVMPEVADDDGAYLVWRANNDGSMPATPSALGLAAWKPDFWLQYFADFDGDARPDFVGWQLRNGAGEPGGGSDNYRIARSASNARHKPIDVISTITSGLGAKTSINYQPMTNPAVYRKGSASPSSPPPGRGSAVHELLGAMPLVASVTSDAPSVEDSAATSTILYQYSGARIQGGGRGLLGFEEVRTIDPNLDGKHIITITRYKQEFPYIGMPAETRRYRISSAALPYMCVTENVEAAPICTFASGPFPEPTGQLLHFAQSRYAFRYAFTDTPVNNGARPVFPYLAASFEAAMNPEQPNESVSATLSRFTFSDLGNNLVSDVAHAGAISQSGISAWREEADARNLDDSLINSCGNDCIRRERTESTYAQEDTTNWRLGRLTTSTTKRWRSSNIASGGDTRTTAFSYDMTSDAKTGLLVTETLQPDGPAATQTMRKTHLYDEFGNEIGVLSCSGDIAVADCDDQSDMSAFLQRPAGQSDLPLTSVRRFVSTVFDAEGRYPLTSLAPFFSGATSGTQADPQSTGVVSARDPWGQPTVSHDANGVGTYADYGPFGQALGSSSDLGAAAASEQHWCSNFGNGSSQVTDCPQGAVFRATSHSKGGARSVQYFDMLGRAYLKVAESFEDAQTGNNWAATCTVFDRRSRSVEVSEPFFLSPTGFIDDTPVFSGSLCQSRLSATTEFDEFDRPKIIRMPEHTASAPAQTRYSYFGLQTTTMVDVSRDDNGDGSPDMVTLTSIETKDATGLVVSTQDAHGLVTNYAYDAFDNLVNVARNGGSGVINSTVTYDALGRKTSQSDPDAGITGYVYNALGELICSSDARGIVTVNDYDALGRVWRIRSGPGSCATTTPVATTYTADLLDSVPALGLGVSRVLDITRFDTEKLGQPSHTTRWQTTGATYDLVDRYIQDPTYDPWGRVESSATTTGPIDPLLAETYVTSTTYDALGRVATVIDATGGGTENMYTPRGFLRRVRDVLNKSLVYWELLEVDARGQSLREHKHNGVIRTQRGYDVESGRLQSIYSSSITNAVLQDLTYSFDALGNLIQRSDLRAGRQERFQYDQLNRLLQGAVHDLGNGSAKLDDSIRLSYDALGNICSKNDHAFSYASGGGCGFASGAAGPHAVLRRNVGPGVSDYISYQYDPAGNQVAAIDHRSNGSEGRQIRFNAGGLADRVATSSSAVSEFRYGGGGRYLRIDSLNGASKTTTRYLPGIELIIRPDRSVERKRYIGGFLILTEKMAGTAIQSREYRYQLGDHLGSIDTLVDETGTVRERLSFDPHGNRRQAEGANAWLALVEGYAAPNTTHGFTGHEHIDLANIVHMNGRLYDPALGRMLSPDPVVQELYNAQNLNRYTYVLNNPLSFTDPSGLNFVKKYWRQIAAAAVMYFTMGQSWWVDGLFQSNMMAASAVSGFISGGVSSGDMRGAFMGAFSAVIFSGIGQHFDGVGGKTGGVFGSGLTASQFGGKIALHAMAGGITGVMQGGKFGHSAASAGIAQFASPAIDTVDAGNAGFSAARVVVASIVGGTTSALTGGKFANGAATAAFSYAFRAANRRAAGDADGNGEPDAASVTPPGIRWPNSSWRDNISVTTSGNETLIDVSLTVSYDEGFTRDYVDGAIAEIGSNWSVSRAVIVGRSYTMRVNLTRIEGGNGDLHLKFWRDADVGYYAKGQIGGSEMSLSTIDRHLTRAHEFGHNLGFRHQWNFTNSMNSYSGNRSVTYQDLEGVARAYGSVW
jgi:RHS repeat-associated protein